MQTPKARTSPLKVPQKTSPSAPRTVRQGKAPGSDSDSVSPHPASRTPKEMSPKVIERKSPRSPAPEKKRPSRVSELESQLAQLQEDLEKTKEQLSSSDSWKRQAQQETEEAKKHLLVMSAKVKESQQQLMDLSASEEDRVQELRKISYDRDLAWQSELEAVQKQHLMDTAALASALNEIQKLKVQLEKVAASEAAQAKQAELAHTEIHNLRREFADTLTLVKNLKAELSVVKESEARALEVDSNSRAQLETAKKTEDALRSDVLKAIEAYNSIAVELKQSKARVNSLEVLVSNLPADCNSKNSADPSVNTERANENGENEDSNQLKEERNLVEVEASQLRYALDATEVRYQEDYIQSTLQIRCAYEQVERAKSESCLREAELKAELNQVKVGVEELKAKLMDKESALQGVSEENEVLNLKIQKILSNEIESEMETQLKKLEADLADMKSSLMDKEMNLQSILEENEMLKSEVKRRDVDRNKMKGEAAEEREALLKLGYLKEEAYKHSKRAARVTEQLNAAQATNWELEAKLRRLKVQSDQWRKAAEAAATMLSPPGSNRKLIERTGSLNSNIQAIGGKMGSPYSDETDDDSPKKKNRNMLKKIGVLWKKGQK